MRESLAWPGPRRPGGAGEAPPGPSEGTPAPAGQGEPRQHRPVAAGGCSPRDLGSDGRDLKRVTADLEGVKGPPGKLRPPVQRPSRNRIGCFAFRNNQHQKPFVLSGDNKANKKGTPPGFFGPVLGRCCIALRTGRFRRRTAIELPAVTTLSRLFPQKFSSNRRLAGPSKLPPLSRRAQIPPSARLSPNSFSWVCSTCPRTCTTGATEERAFGFFFFPIAGGEKNPYPPGSAAWPEQRPEVRGASPGQRCAEHQSLEAEGEGDKIRRRAKEF